MKSLIKIFGILFLSAVSFTACVDDDGQEYCSATFESAVTEVTGPATSTVGQQVTLVVKFESGNQCYVSSYFVETGTNPKEVKVFSRYVGCACAESTEIVSKDYKFTPNVAGDYSFKFKKEDNTFITKTVTVTP